MPDELSDLAKRVEYWRKVRGISQAELSTRAGISLSGVNDLIRHPERSPRLVTVEQLAVALGISLWQLLGDENPDGSVAAAGGGQIDILPWDSLAQVEHAYFSAQIARVNSAIDAARLGRVVRATCLDFVYGAGEFLAIVQMKDYSGQTVVVTIGDNPCGYLRYCAPPWLIGFDGANPFHEYMDIPGHDILGAVRRLNPL